MCRKAENEQNCTAKHNVSNVNMSHAGKFPVFAQPTHPKLHFLMFFFFFCEKVNINLVVLLQTITPENLKVTRKSQIVPAGIFFPWFSVQSWASPCFPLAGVTQHTQGLSYLTSANKSRGHRTSCWLVAG